MRLNIILNFSYLVILIIILFGSEIQASLGNYKAIWISRTLQRSETKKIPKKFTRSESNKIPKLSTRSENNKIPESLTRSENNKMSKILTRSENNKIPKSKKEVKSQGFSPYPKEFQKKSDKEIIGKYCRFLLGAYRACVANFLGFKLRRKVRENKEKQKKKREDTSTTVLPIPTTSSLPNEKIYFRL